MKKKQLRNRVVAGVEGYLEDKGYKVEERDFLGFMVARDGGELVFLSIEPCFGDFPDRHVSRKEFEDACVAWLITHGEGGNGVRCDLVDLRVVKEHEGFARHEIGHMRLY